jgi:hypothetical protein
VDSGQIAFLHTQGRPQVATGAAPEDWKSRG